MEYINNIKSMFKNLMLYMGAFLLLLLLSNTIVKYKLNFVFKYTTNKVNGIVTKRYPEYSR